MSNRSRNHEPKFNRRNKQEAKRGLKRWTAAYLSCLFEERPVHVLPKYQRELDLFLW